MKCLDFFVCTLMRRTKTKKSGKQSHQRLLAENIPNISRLLTSLACCPNASRCLQSDCYLCKSKRPQLFQKSGHLMREKMGDNKKFKKEREKRKGKNKKLQKEELAWLTQNTRFDKSNINAWHKVRTL